MMKNFLFQNRTKMLSVQFYLRNSKKSSPNKMLTIQGQLQIENWKRDVPFSTSVRIAKKYWSGQMISAEHPESKELNQKLDFIRNLFNVIYFNYPNSNPGEDLSYEKIRRNFNTISGGVKIKNEKKSANVRFTQVLRLLIDHKVNVQKRSKGTVKNYNCREKVILEFLKESKLTDIDVKSINHDHIDGLITWMERKLKYGKNHINKHATLFKSVIDFAVRKKYIKNYPLGKLELEYDAPKPPKYILKIHREVIKKVKVPFLQRALHIAMFLWSTGLSYIDYCRLTVEHLIKVNDGWGIKIARGKSNNYSFPIILPDAKFVLEFYGGVDNLPKPHISDLNKELKLLANYAGVSKEVLGFELSTSIMRETCASMLENELMLPDRTIMFWLGHVNPKQLRNYSQVRPERIFHDLLKDGSNLLTIEYKRIAS